MPLTNSRRFLSSAEDNIMRVVCVADDDND